MYTQNIMNLVKHILTCAGVTLLVSSCASNLAPSSGSSQSASSAPTSVTSGERAVAERVFSLVNAERSRIGKRSLTPHSGLIAMAQKNSYRMAIGHREATHELSHMAKDSRSQYAYLKHSVENMNELTITVPAGHPDPAAKAVARWSHRHAGQLSAINQGWHVVGVGVKKTSSATYITLCLGAQTAGVPRSVQPIGW